jgi:hypothetical protein
VVPGTDAWGYLSTAVNFYQNGLFDGLGNVRTFGYPFILYLLTPFAGSELIALSFYARCAQLILYGGVVCWFAFPVTRDGPPSLGLAVAAGLLLNPVLVALVGDVLTEMPTLILAVFTFLCLYGSARARTALVASAWVVAGALASNFALMVRPANALLIIVWNVARAASLLTARPFIRVHFVVGYVGVWTVTAVVTWGPQIAHNLSLGHAGLLPAFNLFKLPINARGLVLAL